MKKKNNKYSDRQSLKAELLDKRINGFYNVVIKRFLDCIVAVIAFLILIPLYICISLTILMTSGRPVIYKQYRGGYKNKKFQILKFRTMIRDADKKGSITTMGDDPRITKVGKFLRRTKLDEIPQIVNIIRGEMSFVGPRPELLDFTSRFTGSEKNILRVRPGITDFSSLHFFYMDEIADNNEYFQKYILPRKNQLRVKYVESVSLRTDFLIFFKTVFRLMKHTFRGGRHKLNKKMEYVTLHDSGLKVSRICMSCDLSNEHKADITKKHEFQRAVKYARKRGINFFEVDGNCGGSKTDILLGKILRNDRTNVTIATKIGKRFGENGTIYHDNSPSYIRETVTLSLRRLRTSYIDLFQIQRGDDTTPLKDVICTLEELRRQGLIRYYGFCDLTDKDILDLKSFEGLVTAFQTRYSLLHRDNENKIMTIRNQLQMTPLAWGSPDLRLLHTNEDMHPVLNANVHRSDSQNTYFQSEGFMNDANITDFVQNLALRRDKTISAITIRFVLDYIPDSVVCIGMKNKQQVFANCTSMGWHLDDDELRSLDDITKESR